MNFLIVEDNVIKNRVVSDTKIDPSWVEEEYPTNIGWKFVEKYNSFMPSSWSGEQWELYYNNELTKFTELKNYYQNLSQSPSHMEKFEEEKRNEINNFYQELVNLDKNINQKQGYIFSIAKLPVEPIEVRPNLDSEV